MTEQEFQEYLFRNAVAKLESEGLNLNNVPSHWPVSRRTLYNMKEGNAPGSIAKLAEFLGIGYEVDYNITGESCEICGDFVVGFKYETFCDGHEFAVRPVEPCICKECWSEIKTTR
jgi:hypothetical protein